MTRDILDMVEYYGYVSPRLEVRAMPSHGGYGLFARKPIEKDQVLTVWAGIIIAGDKLVELPEAFRHRVVQVEEDLYQVSLRPDEPADLGNHSCDPNAGLRGQITLVAMRDIAVGEEMCFDYAMCDGSPYDEFDCACGVPGCRGRITGDDWRRPELWARYDGYFSPYLQRRINRLRAQKKSPV